MLGSKHEYLVSVPFLPDWRRERQREKEEEKEEEGRSGGRGGDRRESAGLVVQIFCLNWDAEGGCKFCLSLLDLLVCRHRCFRVRGSFKNLFSLFKRSLLCQTLRAQEAAQAEAEEREDFEITAEAAGTELQPKSINYHGFNKTSQMFSVLFSKCQHIHNYFHLLEHSRETYFFHRFLLTFSSDESQLKNSKTFNTKKSILKCFPGSILRRPWASLFLITSL